MFFVAHGYVIHEDVVRAMLPRRPPAAVGGNAVSAVAVEDVIEKPVAFRVSILVRVHPDTVLAVIPAQVVVHLVALRFFHEYSRVAV